MRSKATCTASRDGVSFSRQRAIGTIQADTAVPFVFCKSWRSTPIKQLKLRKDLALLSYSSLPSPTYPFPTQSIYCFFFLFSIPLAQRQLCSPFRSFSLAFAPRSPGERHCNEMRSLTWPFSEVEGGGGQGEDGRCSSFLLATAARLINVAKL